MHALPEHGRTVEVGCGGGRILNTVARHRPGLDLHGCDIRPIDAPASFEFRIVDPDVPELPYEAGSVDVVILYDVLEHLPDPAASLAAAHRILRPGGLLVSFTPLEGQPFSVYRWYRRLFGDDLYVATKEHLQAFSEHSLLSMAEPWFRVRRPPVRLPPDRPLHGRHAVRAHEDPVRASPLLEREPVLRGGRRRGDGSEHVRAGDAPRQRGRLIRVEGAPPRARHRRRAAVHRGAALRIASTASPRPVTTTVGRRSEGGAAPPATPQL